MDGQRVSPADCGFPFGEAAWVCGRYSHTRRKVVWQDAYRRATCSKCTLPPGSRHARKQPRLGTDKAFVASQGTKATAHRRMAGCATVVGCRAFCHRPNAWARAIHLYRLGYTRQEARSFRDGPLLLFDHVSHGLSSSRENVTRLIARKCHLQQIRQYASFGAFERSKRWTSSSGRGRSGC